MRHLVERNIKAILTALSAYSIQYLNTETANTPEEYAVMGLYALIAAAITWAIPNKGD